MSEVVVIIDKKDLEALGALRMFPRLRAAAQGERIWLRLDWEDTEIPFALQKLPALQTRMMDENGNLFPIDARVPDGEMPDLEWQALRELLSVEAPVSALPGTTEMLHRHCLVRAAELQKSEAILTSFDTLLRYAEFAPRIRLERLRFALSASGMALVVGDLLPPLPGKEYFRRDSLMIPCGFDLEFPSMSPVIARKLDPHEDSILLMSEEGDYESLPRTAFVQARRSALRKTKGGFGHGNA